MQVSHSSPTTNLNRPVKTARPQMTAEPTYNNHWSHDKNLLNLFHPARIVGKSSMDWNVSPTNRILGEPLCGSTIYAVAASILFSQVIGSDWSYPSSLKIRIIGVSLTRAAIAISIYFLGPKSDLDLPYLFVAIFVQEA